MRTRSFPICSGIWGPRLRIETFLLTQRAPLVTLHLKPHPLIWTSNRYDAGRRGCVVPCFRTRCKYIRVSSVALSAWAPRVRGTLLQDSLQVHPCKLGRDIHVAHGPEASYPTSSALCVSIGQWFLLDVHCGRLNHGAYARLRSNTPRYKALGQLMLTHLQWVCQAGLIGNER